MAGSVIGALRVNLGLDSAQFIKNIDAANKKTARATSSMAAAFKGLAGAVAASFGVSEIVRLADTYTSMTAQLKLVTKSTAELAQVEGKLFEMAQKNRVGFESTVGLYARIARSTETLGVSQEKVLRVTETINKALVISGTSSAAASGGLMQLGQAFASGTLRGDELNSILEQMPRVAQAIAEGMGITVGQLRKFGEQGKLTSEAVFNALVKQGEAIDKEFAKMPATIGQSVTVVGNSLLRLIGVFDQSNQVSASFANGIMGLAKTLDGAGASIRTAINLIVALGGGFLAYRGTLLAVTGAQAAYTAAMVVGTRVIGAAQAASLGLNATMAANPFGAVALAVGVLTTSFIALGNAQKQARAETDNLIRSLDAAIKARGADVALKRAEADAERGRAQARLTELEGQLGRQRGVGAGFAAQALGQEITDLRWKVVQLEGTVRLADRTLKDMEQSTNDIKVPTAQAATASSNLSNALSGAGSAATAASNDFQQLYDRLFPFAAATREFYREMALIQNSRLSDAEKEAAISRLEAESFRNRTSGLGDAKVSGWLNDNEPLVDLEQSAKDYLDAMSGLGDKTQVQTVTIAESFAQMAQRVTSSLQGLANSIRSGDFLGILGGVLDIVMQLGSAGVFGKKFATRVNTPRSFEGGGFTGMGSRTGGLDGKGGFMAMLHPNESVIDHTKGGAGGRVHVTVGVDPRSGNLTAFVDGRAAQMVPVAANVGAMQAQSMAAQSARRRVR